MALTTETFGDVVVVHSPDELSVDHASSFESFLKTVTPPRVVLDMDGTELLDSAGLTAILDGQDELRERGGDMKIATNNAPNRKILEITRLDHFLEVYESVIDAVNSYR